jgi:hypothetical protein
MATYNGSEKYRAGWADPQDVQRWVYDELCIGETLVFPKGQATIGDTTADIDGELGPDIIADLMNPLSTFSEQSFDTVYCDPPYKFYSEPHEDWLRPLWRVARERLVLQTPRQRVTLPYADKDWYVAEPNAGSPQTNVWLFQVFDRVDGNLGDY